MKFILGATAERLTLSQHSISTMIWGDFMSMLGYSVLYHVFVLVTDLFKMEGFSISSFFNEDCN